MLRYLLSGCVLFTLLCSIGCGGGPAPKKSAPTVIVKGTINLDGAPMPTGEIRFSVPGEPVATMPISNGAFAGTAPPGKNAVEVYLFTDGPPLSTDPKGPPTKVNTLPPQYCGTGTTLSANVIASGPNEFRFDITR